jgi:F5/8 type C domain
MAGAERGRGSAFHDCVGCHRLRIDGLQRHGHMSGARADALVSQDAFVDANDDGAAAIDSAGDTSDDDVLTTDIMVGSNDGTLETGSGDADAADDGTDGTTDASDGADAGPPPADTGPPPDTGMSDADAGMDAPPDVGPPPKCKSVVLVAKGAVASSTSDPNVAAGAIDKDFTTRWESVWGVDPQWIYVDFGAPVSISRVQILWLRACAASYDIQVSNSTSGPWTTIRSIVGNAVGSSVSPTDWSTAVDHTGLVGVGRYLRIFGSRRCDTNYGYSFWEIQVSGDPNPPCTP